MNMKALLLPAACLPVTGLIFDLWAARSLIKDFKKGEKGESTINHFNNSNKILFTFNTISLITTIASLYFLGLLGTTLGIIAVGAHCLPLVGRVCFWGYKISFEKIVTDPTLMAIIRCCWASFCSNSKYIGLF